MKTKIRIVINIIIAVTVFAAWASMFVSGEGNLSSAGIASLKYFTVLSNLLAGIAAVIWIAVGRREENKRAELLKYISAAAVTLTFVTIMLFLGPLYGLPAMLKGANLWLHLIVPLFCIAEQLFLSGTDFSAGQNLLVVLPPLLYGIGYLINLLVNGIGTWPDTNDWYGFVNWGLPVGLLIFLVILVLTWLFGFLFRKAGKRKRA